MLVKVANSGGLTRTHLPSAAARRVALKHVNFRLRISLNGIDLRQAAIQMVQGEEEAAAAAAAAAEAVAGSRAGHVAAEVVGSEQRLIKQVTGCPALHAMLVGHSLPARPEVSATENQLAVTTHGQRAQRWHPLP